MDSKDKISLRQLSVLAFFCFFSPAIRILPNLSVQMAGKPAWLSPLVAAVPLALYMALFGALLNCRREGEGLPELFSRCIGKVPGKILTAVFAVYFTLYSGFALRADAERMLSTIYRMGGISFFTVGILIVSLVIGMGKVRSIARMAQLMTPFLIAILLMLIGFAAIDDLKPEYLLPVTYLDTPEIILGALPVVDVFGVIPYILFLSGYVEKTSNCKGSLMKWSFIALGIIFLVMAVTIGTLSAPLVDTMQYPFFTVVHNIKLFKIIDRIEAIIVATWLAADVLYESALLMIAGETMRSVFKMKKRSSLVAIAAVIAFIMSFFVSTSAVGMRGLSEWIVPTISSVLVFGIIPIVFLVGKLRKKLRADEQDQRVMDSTNKGGGSAVD